MQRNGNQRMKVVPRLLIALGILSVLAAIGYAGTGYVHVFRRVEPVPVDHDRSQLDSLPMVVNDSMIKPLRTLVDDDLQKSLEGIISRNKKWSALASGKKLGVALVDLRDPYHVKFARVNGGHMMMPVFRISVVLILI